MSEGLAKALGVQSVVTPIEKKEQSPGDKAVLKSNALDSEVDPFQNLYESGVADNDVKIIKPPFNPLQLYRLVQQNNTLGQCVSAMEVNVDGTGFEVVKKDEAGKDSKKDTTAENIAEFLKEPFPDVSLTTMRRELRRDMEACGNAYVEVLRNKKGEITVLNRLDPKVTRLVRLGDAVVVEKAVKRNGKDEKIQISIRERRYAQTVGTKVVYFKEFGSIQNLDKTTGKFEEEKVEEGKEATEVIHMVTNMDVNTPYGVPRWINQMPSVLGSRKAEEFNLEFFDHGGLPPALVMIQGGQLSKESRDTLTNYLSGKAKYKQRAVMVEAFSTGGDINSAGNVKIVIERFGAERQGDSMFENYDERCSQRVRGAFRLPPMFLGLAQDYNFATAYTAYMVAEAQVFQPERTEFDDMMNVKIMSEINPDYEFKSLPLTVKDVETQLKALRLVQNNVEGEGVVDAVNDLGNLNLTYKEPEPMEQGPGQIPGGRNPQVQGRGNASPKPEKPLDLDPDKPEKPYDRNSVEKIMKIDDELLKDLADDWAQYQSGEVEFPESSVTVMKQMVDMLAPEVRHLFDNYVGERIAHPRLDPEGTSELLALAAECDHDHQA
jgi:PBSX family phage portal protein